jgi:chromosome segregation ATPase
MNMNMGNLREEQEEKQRLEKSNFDLKMKVYYLEESLKRFQDGEDEHDGQYESMKLERGKMKMEMEEKNIDIEQRNLLLLKSKSAIDALKMEIERLRAEGSHHTDLEERVRRLKQLNDDMESDLRGQIAALEMQLASTRNDVDSKEREKAVSEDKLVRV